MPTPKSNKQKTTGSKKSVVKEAKTRKRPEQEDPPIIVKGGTVRVETREVPIPIFPPPHPKRPFGVLMATTCTVVAVYEKNGNIRGDLKGSFSFPPDGFWVEFS